MSCALCIWFLHIWMACTWESYSYDNSSFNVSYLLLVVCPVTPWIGESAENASYKCPLNVCFRVLAVVWRREAQIYLILSTAGHYSLFPLLFTAFELPIKVLLLLIHALYAFLNLSHLFALDKPAASWTLPLLNRIESLYLVGLLPLFLFEQVVHPALGWSDRFPFLPLLFTSAYCACGVSYCFLQYYWHFMKMSGSNHKRKTH